MKISLRIVNVMNKLGRICNRTVYGGKKKAQMVIWAICIEKDGVL